MGAGSLASVAILAALIDVAPPPNGEAVDLVAVRDQARKLRATLPKGEPIEVRFAPGTYFVTNTLSLYRADGNTVWRAATPGTVVISGGIEIPRGRFAAKKVNGVDALVADVQTDHPHPIIPPLCRIGDISARSSRKTRIFPNPPSPGR